MLNVVDEGIEPTTKQKQRGGPEKARGIVVFVGRAGGEVHGG